MKGVEIAGTYHWEISHFHCVSSLAHEEGTQVTIGHEGQNNEWEMVLGVEADS